MPPAAGEAGCEDPKVKAPVEAAVCAPNEKGVDWLKVEGLLGAELDAEGCPKGLLLGAADAPNEKGADVGAVAEVGVVPNPPKPPAV